MKSIKKVELRARMIRVAELKVPYNITINGPQQVAKAAMSILDGEDQEVFLTFMLNIKNKILGYTEVARGAVDFCPVDQRAVFRAAVIVGASGIVAAHCHPSGDPEPSIDDRTMTERLVKVGEVLGIKVLDHVIVGCNGFVSMAEKGWL